VGYFNVDEDQIGINERGQVKVWLNTAFESNEIVGNRNVTESEMLQDILGFIYQTTDHDSYPENIPNLLEYIGAPNKNSTFADVSNRFKSYVK
jgi:hypothetical protein